VFTARTPKTQSSDARTVAHGHPKTWYTSEAFKHRKLPYLSLGLLWCCAQGVEQAYRYTAKLFAQQRQEEQNSPPPCARAPAHGQAVDEGSVGGGDRHGAEGALSETAAREAIEDRGELAVKDADQPPQQATEVVGTDFFDFDVASPQVRFRPIPVRSGVALLK